MGSLGTAGHSGRLRSWTTARHLAELSFPDHELVTFKGHGTIVFLETARKEFAVIMVNEAFFWSLTANA